jgi:VanZ family protein
MVDRTDSMFVEFPAATSSRRLRSTGRKDLPCCALWRDYDKSASRAVRIVHTLAHSRVPFSIGQVLALDGRADRGEIVRAIECAVLAKWVYELDDRQLHGRNGPRLWQGKL